MRKINLSKLGIRTTRRLNEKEKNFISNYVADKLIEKYPYIKFNYMDITSILYNTKMYVAKSPSNISSVNYIYKNQSIYFSKTNDLFDIDECTIHECIHRIQDRRNKKGKLMQLGNCEFTDTKVKGLFLNEAAIQYIVAKILEKKTNKVICCDLNIKTINSSYYPIISNLIEQIVLLLGEDQMVQSTICGDNDFNYQLIDWLGLKEFTSIRDNFDKIQELQIDNRKKENNEKIKEIYNSTQKIIYENYFNKIINYIDNLTEVKDTQNKIKIYSNFIVDSENYEDFKKFAQNKNMELEELKRKIKSKQALVPIKKNIWNKISFKFKDLFKYRK